MLILLLWVEVLLKVVPQGITDLMLCMVDKVLRRPPMS